jgi:hypothetical protein
MSKTLNLMKYLVCFFLGLVLALLITTKLKTEKIEEVVESQPPQMKISPLDMTKTYSAKEVYKMRQEIANHIRDVNKFFVDKIIKERQFFKSEINSLQKEHLRLVKRFELVQKDVERVQSMLKFFRRDNAKTAQVSLQNYVSGISLINTKSSRAKVLKIIKFESSQIIQKAIN